MIVGLLRHGPAVPRGTPGIPDDERPLTPQGRKRTERAARGLRWLRLGFDRVVSSPLPRARETAEIVAAVLGLPDPVFSERLVPEAPAKECARLLDEAGAQRPLWVGHEPLLSSVLALWVGAGEKGGFEIRKPGLAVVACDSAGRTPRATLLLLLTPRVLRRLR